MMELFVDRVDVNPEYWIVDDVSSSVAFIAVLYHSSTVFSSPKTASTKVGSPRSNYLRAHLGTYEHEFD